MAENREVVNIYEYIDYRKFLHHKFIGKKQQDKSFSYRKFALFAGLASPNFLKLVVENKRNLSKEGIPKFAKGFRLSEEEKDYFRNMVLMNQSKNHKEKDIYYQQMIECSGFDKTRLIQKREYEYFSRWYYPVIRELVVFKNGDVDAKWIADQLQPKITVPQARRALTLLEELGMIKTKNNRWKQYNPVVSSGPEASSVLMSKFHDNMISLARESIERFPSHQRDISSVTMRANKKTIAKIKKEVIEFRKRLIQLECCPENAETVIQVNIQAFPTTKIP